MQSGEMAPSKINHSLTSVSCTYSATDAYSFHAPSHCINKLNKYSSNNKIGTVVYYMFSESIFSTSCPLASYNMLIKLVDYNKEFENGYDD